VNAYKKWSALYPTGCPGIRRRMAQMIRWVMWMGCLMGLIIWQVAPDTLGGVLP